MNINGEEYETIDISPRKEQNNNHVFPSNNNSDIDDLRSMYSRSTTVSSSVTRTRITPATPKTLNIYSDNSSVISFKDDDTNVIIDYSIPKKSSVSLGYR